MLLKDNEGVVQNKKNCNLKIKGFLVYETKRNDVIDMLIVE